MSIERGPINPHLTSSQYRFTMGRLSSYYDTLNDNPAIQPVRDAAQRHLNMLDQTLRPNSSSGLIKGLEQRLSS